MDSSISHDPHAPDFPVDTATVNRWHRVGATDDEIRVIAPGFDDASVDDAALIDHLNRYRAAQGPSSTSEGLTRAPMQRAADGDQGPGDTTDGPAEDGTEVTEAQALDGEWTPIAPVEIDGTSYPAWQLEGGWMVILVGDEHNGVHLIGYGIEGVTEKLASEIHSTGEVVADEHKAAAGEQAPADVEGWQASKHLDDAKARATA